jgi:RimJ/RimL family protein N-acetyltransferase
LTSSQIQEISSKIVPASTSEDKEFFYEAVGYMGGEDFRGIKFVEEGRVLAMVGYDYWTLNAVHAHIYIGDARALVGRIFLREIFRYPFEQAGRGLVIAYTPAYNTQSLKLQRFLGFREIARIPDGWAIGSDMVISELRKESCVWLRPIHEQTSSRCT